MYIGSNYQLSAPWQLIIWKNIVMTIYIHILGHSADAFVRSNLQKFRHTFIHRWPWLQRKVPTSTSGAVWGSVSCPRPLRHADQGNQTSSHLITTRWLPCAPWASLLGLYLLLICRSSSVYSLLCCFIVAVCVCVLTCWLARSAWLLTRYWSEGGEEPFSEPPADCNLSFHQSPTSYMDQCLVLTRVFLCDVRLSCSTIWYLVLCK